jgi:hypothetical protein
MTTVTIKSITAVRAHGAGNNGNWVARVRHTDGSELFAGFGVGYSMHQAQSLINNARGSVEHLELAALPDGVTIKAV